MKRCCVCNEVLPGGAHFTTAACEDCAPVWRIVFSSVDDAIRTSIPKQSDLTVLERALAVEKTRPNPRRTIVLALTRRIRAIKRGAR